MLGTRTSQQEPKHSNSGNKTTSPFFIQPKITINAPGDAYENEADATAERVMRMAAPSTDQNLFFKPKPISTLQRKCAVCEEEEKLQRKESPSQEISSGEETESYLSSIGSSGIPLPESSRKFFEPRFGYDFSSVKIHNDSSAHK